MFSEKDKTQISKRGSKLPSVQLQIENFKKGFPYLPIKDAASVENGIIKLDPEKLQKRIELYDKKVDAGIEPLKFVPASGAASRMFKALFEALEECANASDAEAILNKNKAVEQYINEVEKFAFYPELKVAISTADEKENCKTLIDSLLNEKGLNYGALPKGLLKFHSYGDNARTPFEEHIAEGAQYAKDSHEIVKIHFTVSPEHQPVFETLLIKIKEQYEAELKVKIEVSFSQQKPSTDTIAVDLNNEPFRENDGTLLFRPGGHGALIENLNDLDADVIFIKNIDNVVPDKLKAPTIKVAITAISILPTASIINLYMPSNMRIKAPEIPGRIMAQMAIEPDKKINQ